jgi:hypothetical protein
MAFRPAAAFGKRQEFVAIAELLRRDFDVYLTLVDDQQIDCIIRQKKKDGQLRYLDIQIKARSDVAKNAGFFSAMEIRKPRENFYFIFYSEQANTYWVIPSLELVKEANQNKSGKNVGRYNINFCNITKAGVTPRPRFKRYENAFDFLFFECGGFSPAPQTSKLSLSTESFSVGLIYLAGVSRILDEFDKPGQQFE